MPHLPTGVRNQPEPTEGSPDVGVYSQGLAAKRVVHDASGALHSEARQAGEERLHLGVGEALEPVECQTSASASVGACRCDTLKQPLQLGGARRAESGGPDDLGDVPDWRRHQSLPGRPARAELPVSSLVAGFACLPTQQDVDGLL